METVIRAKLTGENDQLGEMPAADLAKLILGLQQALAAAASTVVRQRRRGVTGRHPAAVEAASRLRLKGVEPGSVEAVFALPDLDTSTEESLDIGDIPDLAQLAFERLVQALTSTDPDPDLARAIARLGDEMNVGGGGRTIRFSSDNGRVAGVLDLEVRQRMAIYARSRPVQRDELLVGSLVEADFEKHTARLQPLVGPPVQVTFPEEMADAIHDSLRHVTEMTGSVTYARDTLMAIRIDVVGLTVAQADDLGIDADSFWHHQTFDQLAREQGITRPPSLADLQAEVEFTPEEIEAFLALIDE